MVVTDIQFCFAAGALFADLAAPAIVASTDRASFTQSPIYLRLQRRLLLYPALFLGPAATLFMLAWPGWESQYVSAAFSDSAGAPWHALLFALFLLLLTGAAALGNWLGFRWVLGGARRRLRIVYGLVLTATVGLVLARWPALIHLGSFADFVRGPESMPYVWQDTTFFTWFCVLTAYCGLPLGVLAWLAYREPSAVARKT
jgi:hypothetical protein